MLSKILRLCIIVQFVHISCSRHEQDIQIPADAYLPLESGRFSEFNVARTRYLADGEIIHEQHYARHLTDHYFYQNNNQQTFPVRYQHQQPDHTWQTDSVSVAWQTGAQIFQQEKGQSVVKICFPLSDGLHWDFNAYNNTGKQLCEVQYLDKSCQAGTLNFPHTVTIIRQNDSTLLSLNKYIETYAQNVGLVKSERINLQYCYSADCVGKGIIQSGWKEVSIIQKFGKQ